MTEIKGAWEHAPILEKVLIGNAVVILAGAIGGTFITNALVQVSGIALALFFSTVGILLSLLINTYILQSALKPMQVLQRTVEQIHRGDTVVRAPVDDIGDPQLKRLAQALNTMLERLATHTRMIEANQVQLRSLSRQVLSAQEDERKRIARELHDDTSGALARVLLNIEMCEESLPAGADSVRGKMKDTRVIVEQTLDGVRHMIFGLRPALLDDLGLAAAVRWYAKSSLEPAGIQVHFDASSNLGRAAPTIETALFRIAQEAMTNVVRHANARHVRVQITREASALILLVQDDGTGFQVDVPEGTASASQHWGLFGVAERVQLLGGTFHIESGVGRGTLLRVQVPLT